MNDKTQAFFKFIKECYNNESVSRNTAQTEVLKQMCCDTDNLGGGFRLNTWMFDGAYPDRESLASAVEFSLKDGLQTLQEFSKELFELSQVGDGDKFFDHHTYIGSVEPKSIQWGELTESLWGDDMDKYFKTAIFLTRHEVLTDQIDYLEGFGYKVLTFSEYESTSVDKVSFTFYSGLDAYKLACKIAGRPLSAQDLVIGVLPISMTAEFLLRCPAPLLRANMIPTTREKNATKYTWTGVYNQTIEFKYLSKRWLPPLEEK